MFKAIVFNCYIMPHRHGSFTRGLQSSYIYLYDGGAELCHSWSLRQIKSR